MDQCGHQRSTRGFFGSGQCGLELSDPQLHPGLRGAAGASQAVAPAENEGPEDRGKMPSSTTALTRSSNTMLDMTSSKDSAHLSSLSKMWDLMAAVTLSALTIRPQIFPRSSFGIYRREAMTTSRDRSLESLLPPLLIYIRIFHGPGRM